MAKCNFKKTAVACSWLKTGAKGACGWTHTPGHSERWRGSTAGTSRHTVAWEAYTCPLPRLPCCPKSPLSDKAPLSPPHTPPQIISSSRSAYQRLLRLHRLETKHLLLPWLLSWLLLQLEEDGHGSTSNMTAHGPRNHREPSSAAPQDWCPAQDPGSLATLVTGGSRWERSSQLSLTSSATPRLTSSRANRHKTTRKPVRLVYYIKILR